jgi:hypothetical protein
MQAFEPFHVLLDRRMDRQRFFQVAGAAAVCVVAATRIPGLPTDEGPGEQRRPPAGYGIGPYGVTGLR